jgi:hypothetical protein
MPVAVAGEPFRLPARIGLAGARDGSDALGRAPTRWARRLGRARLAGTRRRGAG